MLFIDINSHTTQHNNGSFAFIVIFPFSFCVHQIRIFSFLFGTTNNKRVSKQNHKFVKHENELKVLAPNTVREDGIT